MKRLDQRLGARATPLGDR